MKDPTKFEPYDMDKLQKAKDLLQAVLNYYYGFQPMKSKVKRLETIIVKLETLQNLE